MFSNIQKYALRIFEGANKDDEIPRTFVAVLYYGERKFSFCLTENDIGHTVFLKTQHV